MTSENAKPLTARWHLTGINANSWSWVKKNKLFGSTEFAHWLGTSSTTRLWAPRVVWLVGSFRRPLEPHEEICPVGVRWCSGPAHLCSDLVIPCMENYAQPLKTVWTGCWPWRERPVWSWCLGTWKLTSPKSSQGSGDTENGKEDI